MLGTILIVAGLVLIAGALVAWPFLSRSSNQTSTLDRDAEPERSPTTRPTPRRRARGAQPTFLRPPIMVAGAVVCLVLGVVGGVLAPKLLTRSTPTPVGLPGADALEAMEQDLQKTPDDIPKLLFYAHAALDQGQLTRAIPAYKHVLKLDPKNVEAIVHFGSILYQAGHADQALSEMDKALAIDAKYAHAYWDKAHILFNGKHDYAGAQKALQAFLEIIPTGSDADRARALMDEAKRLAAAPPAPATSPAAMPVGNGPGSGATR